MRILQLTNYPTGNPMHGGQLRAWHIANELRRNGHVVKSVAAYVRGHYQPDSADDIEFGPESTFWDPELHFIADYLTGIWAAEDETALSTLTETARVFGAEVIVSEHPWLMAAARKIAAVMPGVKLVYSSHNVEFRLKRGILLKSPVAEKMQEKIVKEIEEIEREAVACADLVVACTNLDSDYYKKYFSGSKVVVAGNGVEPFTCAQGRVEAWRRFVGRPFPVFVSSAHMPNATGFWDMMAPGLTFLRPEERVLVVGGVSDLIMQIKGFDEYQLLNKTRLELIGRVEKSELQAIVSAAHVVLLPIVEGEGSNLKTAEALESGCSIVATTKALRGFEQASDLSHVHVADEPTAFRKKVREILDTPLYMGGTPQAVRSQFYWEHLLSNAVKEIEALRE